MQEHLAHLTLPLHPTLPLHAQACGNAPPHLLVLAEATVGCEAVQHRGEEHRGVPGCWWVLVRWRVRDWLSHTAACIAAYSTQRPQVIINTDTDTTGWRAEVCRKCCVFEDMKHKLISADCSHSMLLLMYCRDATLL